MSDTYIATGVIECESEQSDSGDSSGNVTDVSCEDTEGIPVDQVQGDSSETCYTKKLSFTVL